MILADAGNNTNYYFAQPRNQTAEVGDTVQFNCNYSLGSQPPHWNISGESYNSQQIRANGLERHEFVDSYRVLEVNVTGADDNKTYQCIFVEMGVCSMIATLHVVPQGT